VDTDEHGYEQFPAFGIQRLFAQLRLSKLSWSSTIAIDDGSDFVAQSDHNPIQTKGLSVFRRGLSAMKIVLEQSDGEFLNELHRIGPKTVQDICAAIGVTATAIRQRLWRLQGQQFVARELVRNGRGRPHYVYRVTEKGLRQLGDNYGDLALILWREIRQISDPEIREQITQRIRHALVSRLGTFADERLQDRMKRLGNALLSRGYDVEVGTAAGTLPILRENNCPYQELAEEDRGICGLEREVFEQALGTEVRLTHCCLDGHHCCEFEAAELQTQAAAG
jgi:predicted ArsR family transcriptional regulator